MMEATGDEIGERYLDRVIQELNELNHRIEGCSGCSRGGAMPVLPSGHPQASIMLVKYSARPAEVEEGVAFHGEAGSAVLRSLERLAIDPLAIYGTLCVKCPLPDPRLPEHPCVEHLAGELAVVAPGLVVVMGKRALEAVNGLSIPGRKELRPLPGKLQELAPDVSGIFTPDLDECLAAAERKRAFWQAFRAVGDWYAELPPF